jgi:hypothetical protein
MSEDKSRKSSSKATIRLLCEKPEAIKLLRALDKVDQPLKLSELVVLTSCDYDKLLIIGNKMVEMNILELHRTAVDWRIILYSIKDEDMVKQIFQYDDKLTDKRKAELGAEGVTEV